MGVWTVLPGRIVRTGQMVYFPVFVREGRVVSTRSICYTHTKAQEKVNELNKAQ